MAGYDAAPTCLKPGCGKPTFNGKANEYCSRTHRDFRPPRCEPTKMCDVRDPRPDAPATEVGVIAFYYPDHEEEWDKRCKAGFLGNFWHLGTDALTVADNEKGDKKSFQNSEAAFQALKFWNRADEFRRLTGGGAYRLKKSLKGTEDWEFAGHGNNWQGMLAVLKEKFEDGSEMARLLKETGDAYLIEHNAVRDRDRTWSDNMDGTGANWLGLQNMLVRDTLTGKTSWTEWIKTQVNMKTGDPIGTGWPKVVLDAAKAIQEELPAGGVFARCEIS